MWNRKNFLIFALVLNCIYFIGVSILLARYVSQQDQSPLKAWLEDSSRLISKKLIWDEKRRNETDETLENLNTKKHIEAWAQQNDIVHVVGQSKDEDLNLVGHRNGIPFKRQQLMQKDSVGFFYRNNQLHFSYVVGQENLFLLTQIFTNDNLKTFLEPSKIELTIVEFNYLDDAKVLFTTLPKIAADELVKLTDFEKVSTEPHSLVIEKEVHLVKMESLLHLPNLKQKIIFSKKITQYQIVTLFDLLMVIWTLFCIVMVLNLLLFKKCEPSGSPL